MSATAEDRVYYEAVEAAFIRRRGTPFLLSPSDFALLREWRAGGSREDDPRLRTLLQTVNGIAAGLQTTG